MRKYLFYTLLAALLIPVIPATASADDEHGHGHGHREHGEHHEDWEDDHDRGEHRGEWHHHHHIYRDNYYMGYQPRPVIITPAPIMPIYPVSPSLQINIQ